MIRTMGKVFLGGIQFTTDPSIKRDWRPRRSKLQGIGGSVTQQDFGRFAQDMRLTLTSAAPTGNQNYINQAFKSQVEALMFTRLQAYAYSDYTGLVGTVVIVDFDPQPTFIRDGAGVLFTYTMTLDVMSLTTLDFLPYTGA